MVPEIIAQNTSFPSPVGDQVPLNDQRPTDIRSSSFERFLKSITSRTDETPPLPLSPPHQVLEMVETTRRIPFLLSFTNLTYTVRQNAPRKRAAATTTKNILDNISGEARDGEITAVMGASGSGKSTLIDALANRIAKEKLRGSVKLNGELLESRLLKSISAYVMQDDLLFPMLTVEETLMFAAEFRLPRALSHSKKKARVHALIDQLGLRDAANTVIGDEGHRGISGGERRRVSIGTDIIHDPILLFLDEPTSGLDSTSAFMVVKVLRRIAQSGSIIIMSIHQPSYRILSLLDNMIFLTGGKTVYTGPPFDIKLFLRDFGHPIQDENPMEFALDLIRELEGIPDGTKALVEFHASWQTLKKTSNSNTQSSSYTMSLKEAIAASVSRGKCTSSSASNMVPTTYANPLWIELIILSKRSFINSRRMPKLFMTRLVSVLVTGFILASLFWKLDDSPKVLQERLGFFAFAVSTSFLSTTETLPVFIQERYIFMRETTYNAYRKLSYVVSHALGTLPSLIFTSLVFGIITFWSVGIQGNLCFYLLIIFASFWTGNSFVTFISGFVSQVMIGIIIVVSVLAYDILFSGFFITRNRMPDYWLWFHYTSLIKYPYEGVLQNEFNNPTRCFIRGDQVFDTTPLAAVSEEMKVKLLASISRTLGGGVNITAGECLVFGADVLKNQGITQLGKWSCLMITVVWGFLFRVMFFFVLSTGNKNKRT